MTVAGYKRENPKHIIEKGRREAGNNRVENKSQNLTCYKTGESSRLAIHVDPKIRCHRQQHSFQDTQRQVV